MNELKERNRKLNTLVTILIFVVFLAGFAIASLVKKDGYFSASENRYLEQKPEFSVKTVLAGEFATKYEKYITDQFVFRDQWIRMKSMAELAMQKKDVNDVYIAKDRYLIEMHQDIDVEKATRNRERVCNFVKKQSELLGDGRVTMMVVPTAVDVLKDKLPAFATSFDQSDYIEGMRQELGDNFVDARGTLNDHKDEYIYYRTDHHWTTYGAFLAYQEWAKSKKINALKSDDFNIATVTNEFLGTIYSKVNFALCKDSIEIYEPKASATYAVDVNMGEKQWDTLYVKDALDTKDKYAMFLDGNNAVVTIDTQIENLGQSQRENETLLVIKDSYAHCFIPFLTNHYQKIVVLDLRYCKMPISKVMEQYQITDVLILYNAIHFAQESNFALLDY